MTLRRYSWSTVGLTCCLTAGFLFAGPQEQKGKADRVKAAVPTANTVMWTEPSDIAARNLFFGPGGPDHQPQGPFKFDKEDLDGTNPKFVVKDKDGTKWKVKMGNEARPETVASRIVWAVGYYANEDYFVPEIHVDGMPAQLHRGQKMVGPNGTVQNVRLKREDYKKVGEWDWRDDPFTNTREWNGLRTLMAVINNWDLKDENNAIYEAGGNRIAEISDLGASFGCAGRCWPRDAAKGDLKSYQDSRFIGKLTDQTVSFANPARPYFFYAVNPKEYLSRIHLEWIGHAIPRADARWMGNLLARLSPQQIQDAFLSAGYSRQDVDGFAKVFANRVAALSNL
jgi:hypothetical protein